MWTLLKPHVSTLIERLLFPIFCPTADELEEFTEEPKDWVRKCVCSQRDDRLRARNAPKRRCEGYVAQLSGS